jgi:hypothetical protein
MTLDYYLGEFQKVRSLCEGELKEIDEGSCQYYLAMTYRKLGRDADAETSLRRLIVLPASRSASTSWPRSMRSGAIPPKHSGIWRRLCATVSRT